VEFRDVDANEDHLLQIHISEEQTVENSVVLELPEDLDVGENEEIDVLLPLMIVHVEPIHKAAPEEALTLFTRRSALLALLFVLMMHVIIVFSFKHNKNPLTYSRKYLQQRWGTTTRKSTRVVTRLTKSPVRKKKKVKTRQTSLKKKAKVKRIVRKKKAATKSKTTPARKKKSTPKKGSSTTGARRKRGKGGKFMKRG